MKPGLIGEIGGRGRERLAGAAVALARFSVAPYNFFPAATDVASAVTVLAGGAGGGDCNVAARMSAEKIWRTVATV